jgi:hypothetical protein
MLSNVGHPQPTESAVVSPGNREDRMGPRPAIPHRIATTAATTPGHGNAVAQEGVCLLEGNIRFGGRRNRPSQGDLLVGLPARSSGNLRGNFRRRDERRRRQAGRQDHRRHTQVPGQARRHPGCDAPAQTLAGHRAPCTLRCPPRPCAGCSCRSLPSRRRCPWWGHRCGPKPHRTASSRWSSVR